MNIHKIFAVGEEELNTLKFSEVKKAFKSILANLVKKHPSEYKSTAFILNADFPFEDKKSKHPLFVIGKQNSDWKVFAKKVMDCSLGCVGYVYACPVEGEDKKYKIVLQITKGDGKTKKDKLKDSLLKLIPKMFYEIDFVDKAEDFEFAEEENDEILEQDDEENGDLAPEEIIALLANNLKSISKQFSYIKANTEQSDCWKKTIDLLDYIDQWQELCQNNRELVPDSIKNYEEQIQKIEELLRKFIEQYATKYDEYISTQRQIALKPIDLQTMADLLEDLERIMVNIPESTPAWAEATKLISLLAGKQKTFETELNKIPALLDKLNTVEINTSAQKLSPNKLNLKQLQALVGLLNFLIKTPSDTPHAISFIEENLSTFPESIGTFSKYLKEKNSPPIIVPIKPDHNPEHTPLSPNKEDKGIERLEKAGLVNARYGDDSERLEAASAINKKKSELKRFSGNIAYSKSELLHNGKLIIPMEEVTMPSFSPEDELPQDFTDLELDTKPIFSHLILDTGDYPVDEPRKDKILGNAWPRNRDSEYIILSTLAKKLELKVLELGISNEDIKGEVSIASLYPYCLSCQGIIKQFNLKFPNVRIVIIDNTKDI